MSKYIQSVKCIVDNLAALVNSVTDYNLVSTFLSSLSPEYDSFVTSVNTQLNPVLSEELISIMLNQEIYHGLAITTPDSTALTPLLQQFIPPPALQATT